MKSNKKHLSNTAHDDVLTHLCFRTLLKSIVWMHDAFGNNLRIQPEFIRYLKEICLLGSN